MTGSLGVDIALVVIGTAAFPATNGYGHFHFSDFGTLTAIGVVLACAAWVVVVRLWPDPRRFFFRLAVIVTVVLWLPDVWLLIRHQPATAVLILMAMHLGIALVTYNALIHIAPVGEAEVVGRADAETGDDEVGHREDGPARSAGKVDPKAIRAGRWVWIVMMVGIGVELLAGIAVLVLVPVDRPNGWLPGQGETAYLIHAGLGGILTLVAMWLVTVAPRERFARAGVLIGLAGLVLAAGGGMLTAYHSSRAAGLALMLAGTLVAFFGYLMPVVEPVQRLEVE